MANPLKKLRNRNARVINETGLAGLQGYPSEFVLPHLYQDGARDEGMLSPGHFCQRFGAIADSHGALIDHAVAIRRACYQTGAFQHVCETLRRSVSS